MGWQAACRMAPSGGWQEASTPPPAPRAILDSSLEVHNLVLKVTVACACHTHLANEGHLSVNMRAGANSNEEPSWRTAAFSLATPGVLRSCSSKLKSEASASFLDHSEAMTPQEQG